MSYILDALRKSERARRLGRAPVYRDGSQPAQTRLLRWLSLAAGVVLLATLALSVWLLNRPEAPAAHNLTTSDPAAAPSAPQNSAPESATRSSGPTTVHTAPLAALPVPTETGKPRSEPAATRAAKPTSPPPDSSGPAPWLSSLPDDFRAALPALMVNIHVYAPDERQRILYINNRPLKRGEEIEGVVVEEIVPEGVVLRARGQRFKLPRPS